MRDATTDRYVLPALGADATPQHRCVHGGQGALDELRQLEWLLRLRGVDRAADATKRARAALHLALLRELPGWGEDAPKCTEFAAWWCPVHGHCRCPDRIEFGALYDESCPLHAPTSGHARERATGECERP